MKEAATLSIFVLLALLITAACGGQTKNKEEESKRITIKQTEGESPQITTSVNKHNDSKGNLIKFDSTYSYFYSSKGHDSTKIALDTVLAEFKSFYYENFKTHIDKRFNDIFLTDSLFKYDFLNDDYFRKRFELNMNKMNDLFREMDSLKIHYLKSTQSEKTKDKKKLKN
jgi:outer membrane lipopolysaccharide assembly protein LptE/RlpB